MRPALHGEKYPVHLCKNVIISGTYISDITYDIKSDPEFENCSLDPHFLNNDSLKNDLNLSK